MKELVRIEKLMKMYSVTYLKKIYMKRAQLVNKVIPEDVLQSLINDRISYSHITMLSFQELPEKQLYIFNQWQERAA